MAVPPNITCAAAIGLTLPWNVTVDTTQAPPSSEWADYWGDPYYCGSGSGASNNAVWYTFVTGAGQTKLKVTLFDTTSQACLMMLKGACGSFSANWDACWDTWAYSSLPGHVDTFTNLEPNTRYYFLLTSYDPGGASAIQFKGELVTPAGQFCKLLRCVVLPTSPPPILVNSDPCCGSTKSGSVSGIVDDVPLLPVWTPTYAGLGVVPSSTPIALVERWDY
jgi:hypothetical protein